MKRRLPVFTAVVFPVFSLSLATAAPPNIVLLMGDQGKGQALVPSEIGDRSQEGHRQ